MKKVNVHAAKTNLSSLLLEIEEHGEHYVICRNGVPVADLVPHLQHDRLTPHPTMSDIKIKYDPTEPMGEDEWPAEEA